VRLAERARVRDATHFIDSATDIGLSWLRAP
jgi:hypothetical protein